MKTILFTTFTLAVFSAPAVAGSLKDDLAKNNGTVKIDPKEVLKKYSKDTNAVAIDQDELSADVQDLIQEQTNKKVVDLLAEAEQLMGEASERLEDKKTDGETLAIETEIIEKIYEAAKQKQKKGKGQGKPGSNSNSMLKMMEQMMGKGEKPGEKPGKKPGSKPGEGSTGDSDQANDRKTGDSDNTKEERRVPASKSVPDRLLPKAEQEALDAYNKLTNKP